MKRLKSYLLLIKPGIILGNIVTLLGGFFLASKGDIDFFLLSITVIGLSCIVASACLFNNIIDRDIDKTMIRTHKRILARGEFSTYLALFSAILFFILGSILYFCYLDVLPFFFSIVGFLIYVVVYSLYLKRNSVHNIVIGSISGAMPPIIGYTAVTQNMDSAVYVLFMVFALWQIPHSYAIAIFRIEDYKKANLPVTPIVKGLETTQKEMLIYTFLFTLMALSLTPLGYTGKIYLIVITLLGSFWLAMTFRKEFVTAPQKWAKKLFICSIVVVTATSFFMALNPA